MADRNQPVTETQAGDRQGLRSLPPASFGYLDTASGLEHGSANIDQGYVCVLVS